MRKKALSAILSAAMVLSLAACGQNNNSTTTATTAGNSGNNSATTAATTAAEETLGYTYGLGETFRSDEPVTYSMFFSDANWYPMQDSWKTGEGLFATIAEMTNVTLDVTSIDSSDYNNKISLMINAGQSAYIIPKIYDEGAYVDGGAVVPVSDWVQYMPYYTEFYEKYDMQADIDPIYRADGKYYRLPGMKEVALQDYTFLVRDDIFTAAGYDVATLETDWTWDDLYDVLVGVKAYMVSQGMCKESDYIWSDLWCGTESGQGTGGNLLNVIGSTYNVGSGWGIGNFIQYDADKDEWYNSSITEDYKEYITVLSKFIKGGILDPETFTQDDATANNKFYRGETVIMSVNRSQYTTWLQGLNEVLGEGNYSTYYTMAPKGNKDYYAINNRLECGVMISTKALQELGEEEFIKMLRFVDWLWYSDEGKTLTKWGIQGTHWDYVTDPETGMTVKALTDPWYCGGLGIAQTNESQKDLRIELGYAGGNFWYGGNMEQLTDNFAPVFQDFYARMAQYRKTAPTYPAKISTEDENEQMNIWATPLKDNINTWTLQFAIGQKDVEADWNDYIASCERLNSQQLVDMHNMIYQRTKAAN